MKIEWLNENFTRARLTRGWFRKEVCTVTRVGCEWYYDAEHIDHHRGTHWVFPRHLADMLDEKRASNSNPWQPVTKPQLPTAKLLK